MRGIRVAGCVVVVGVLLGGCGSGAGEDGGKSTSSPSVSVPAPAQPSPEAWEQVPVEDRAAFLDALAGVDPGLVDGENQQERGLRRAVTTCRDIEDGVSGSTLMKRVSQRFTGGHGDVSVGEAEQVVTAAQKWICPKVG